MLNKIHKLKRMGKTIGFTASTFDLLHAGHCAMLSEAKSYCDYLIVGLLTDPTTSRPDSKNSPVQSSFERWVQCASNENIDLIIPFDTEEDLIDMLLLLKPDVRFVGEEYEGTQHTGYDIEGIDIVYNSREHSFSTTDLRERVIEANSDDVIEDITSVKYHDDHKISNEIQKPLR